MLITGLKDPRLEVRLYVAEALGNIGPDAQAAVPDLLQAAKDSNLNLRQNAIRSLGKMGGDVKDRVLPMLTECLNDGNHEVRVAAADALGSLPITVSDVPTVLPFLKHKDAEARAQATVALGRLGSEAKVALKPLIETLKDPNVIVRRAAAECIGQIGADAKEAIPELEKAAKDSGKEVRRAAITALGGMGADAKVAVAAIAKGLDDIELRRTAISALVKIGPPAAKEGAVPLAQVLKSNSKEDRFTALEAGLA